jgi:hypothetical protein
MQCDFVLPRRFQEHLLDILPDSLLTRADNARLLVSTIAAKTAARDIDYWGWVRLSTDVLRRTMDPDALAPIVRALTQGGVIETTGYWVGERCKGYRLTDPYLKDWSVLVYAVDPCLIDRVQRERERQRQRGDEQTSRWRPIHAALDAEQRRLTITSEADDILVALPEHTRLCQHILVSRIRRGLYTLSVSSTERVFNSITGLKRELRVPLRIDGQPVGSCDIRCAQPALLAFSICSQIPSTGPKSAETYKHYGRLGAVPAPLAFPAPCLPLLATYGSWNSLAPGCCTNGSSS